MRSLDGITDSMDVSLSEIPKFVMDGKPGVLRFMGSKCCYVHELRRIARGQTGVSESEH